MTLLLFPSLRLKTEAALGASPVAGEAMASANTVLLVGPLVQFAAVALSELQTRIGRLSVR